VSVLQQIISYCAILNATGWLRLRADVICIQVELKSQVIVKTIIIIRKILEVTCACNNLVEAVIKLFNGFFAITANLCFYLFTLFHSINTIICHITLLAQLLYTSHCSSLSTQ